MTRTTYFLLLIGVAVVLGSLSLLVPEEQFETIGMLTIIVFIPILAILRMRYLKMTTKEVLLSFIPFYGIKYRFRRLFDNKK